MARIWERLGVADVLIGLLKERAFEFPVERAVFVAVLHRLFVSGSDRDCASWIKDYDIPGAEGLDLHHFYRAMAWLGEELEEKPAGALAPRCLKDLVEERLFDRRRDLFTDLSAVFMDTTSLSFYGEGGETLGEHGYSKDYRPDLKQMILGLVVDGDGRPICTEMWPGNTADVTTLLPVVDRLQRRFSIGRVCVVADRGMISAATIAGLEERKLDYILGARERSDAVVRKLVLENDDPFVPLLVERKAGETQLFVKQVKAEGVRYVVCRNEAEAENDRKDREAIVAALDAQLRKGDKALIGNSAYRRGFSLDHATQARKKDELSLLSGISEKDRQRLHSKGIFTVTQLSYTFRPRRRRRESSGKQEKHHHSLRALAVRENKIHAVGIPDLTIEGTPVFLDVEGLPDRDFYYLIGIRIQAAEGILCERNRNENHRAHAEEPQHDVHVSGFRRRAVEQQQCFCCGHSTASYAA